MKNGKLPSGWQTAARYIPARVSAPLARNTVSANFVRHANRQGLTPARDEVKYISLFLLVPFAFILPPVVLFLSLLFSDHTFAQQVAEEIPAHSTSSGSGGGWACDRGYRKKGGACIAVKIPADAYATDSALGLGWKCRRGFKEAGGSCVAVDVPEHGYLTAGRGDTWKCARGFHKKGASCIAIKVPKNGYLSTASYGSGWLCDRGYKAVADTCFAFTVPDNAHIDRLGNDWDCDRPYRKSHDTCKLR